MNTKMQNIGKKYRELIRNKFDRKKIKNKDYTYYVILV